MFHFWNQSFKKNISNTQTIIGLIAQTRSTKTHCSINPACIVTAEIGSKICNFFYSSQTTTGNPLNHLLLKCACWVKAAKSTLRIKRNIKIKVITTSEDKIQQGFDSTYTIQKLIFVSKLSTPSLSVAQKRRK